MTDPCLIVLHQENSSAGRIGHALGQRGVPLDIRRPRYGDPLPPTLAEHVGAIIFGGPMSANDEDDFVRREIDWIAVPLAEKKPFLGDVTHATICRWTTRGHERLALPGAKPRAAHFADRAVHDPAGRAWLSAFLDHWLPEAAAAA